MYRDLKDIQPELFETEALNLFKIQYSTNEIYRQYCDTLQRNKISRADDIPFLPIRFFKTHKVYCSKKLPSDYFESSGSTDADLLSKHYIADITQYEKSIELGYRFFFGDKPYTIVALLPHYLERPNSSLAYMVKHWMRCRKQEEYFYLYNQDELYKCILKILEQGATVLFIGISFALLDFSEKYSIENSGLMIIETGGMKGKRPEMQKIELINALRQSFSKSKIISEYGMCELFSQAYSDEDLWFSCPPWMRVYVSELNDPITTMKSGSGVAKIIDLANQYSCAFIETQDIIELREDGKFRIIGRVDHADIRGCSLLYS